MLILFCCVISVKANQQDKTIRILFTANINGGLENCGCGDNPAGGLDRVLSFFESYRDKHPQTLVMDGGDYFNSYPFLKLDQAMLNALPLLNYDVLAPGEQEFNEGQIFFDHYSHQFQKKLLSSNISGVGVPIKRFIRKYKEVKVISLLSASVFQITEKPDFIKLENKLKHFDNDPESLDILIFHGSRLVLEKQSELLPKFDLVLIGHDQQTGQWQNNETTIIGVGGDGEKVMEITAMRKKGKWHMDSKSHLMDSGIESHPVMIKQIEKFKSENEQVSKP